MGWKWHQAPIPVSVSRDSCPQPYYSIGAPPPPKCCPSALGRSAQNLQNPFTSFEPSKACGNCICMNSTLPKLPVLGNQCLKTEVIFSYFYLYSLVAYTCFIVLLKKKILGNNWFYSAFFNVKIWLTIWFGSVSQRNPSVHQSLTLVNTQITKISLQTTVSTEILDPMKTFC